MRYYATSMLKNDSFIASETLTSLMQCRTTIVLVLPLFDLKIRRLSFEGFLRAFTCRTTLKVRCQSTGQGQL